MGDEFNSLPLELAIAKLSVRNHTSLDAPKDNNREGMDSSSTVVITQMPRDAIGGDADDLPAPDRPEVVQGTGAKASSDTDSVSGQDPDINTQWIEIRQRVRDKSRPAEALLSNARPRDLTLGNLDIGFLHEAHLQNFLDRKKQIAGVVPAEVLDEAVSAVLGADIRVTYSHWPDLGGSTSEENNTSEPTSSGGHLVSEALNLGGQLIETSEE